MSTFCLRDVGPGQRPPDPYGTTTPTALSARIGGAEIVLHNASWSCCPTRRLLDPGTEQGT
jgi:hypothetical protein